MSPESAGFEPFPTWVNGQLYAPGEGVLSVEDAGLHAGLGVLEGLLFEDGHRYFEERHLERFARGAAAVGIAWPLPWDPALALDEFTRGLEGRDAFVRLTATRGVPGLGPTLVIAARPVDRPPNGGVRLAVARGLQPPAATAVVKSTNRLGYTLARERARDAGAHDALLVTGDGSVLEGTVYNLFAIVRERLVTPDIRAGCLPGVTRGIVIEEVDAIGLPIEERRLDLAELAAASEVFVTSSVAGVAGVAAIEGAPVPLELPGSAGRWTGRLAGALRAREQLDRAAHRP